MSFTDLVLPFIAGAENRCQIITDGSTLQFEQLPTCVVFLHAIWSGPSVKSLRAYTTAFSKLELPDAVKFYIVDFDSLPEHLFEKLPGLFGGNGETFFVREGKIVGNIPRFSEEFATRFMNALTL